MDCSVDRNEVLSAVILMERIMPRLDANSRAPIGKQHLLQIQQYLSMVLKQLTVDCKEPLILTPIMEVVNLIDSVMEDETFVETDNETKTLIVDRLNDALSQLYLFAGKYYMNHDFTWSIGKSDVLRHIVDACMDLGYYFGYDVKLRAEGIL